MRRVVAAVLAFLAFLSVPRPAQGTFHSMKIVEVFGGTEAAPTAQYVVLQMWFPGQNLVGLHSLIVYDATGTAIPGATFTFGADLPNGADQAKILIATSAAQTFFGVTPDLTMAPAISPAGGKICWDTTLVDCVAWGGYNGSPLGVGTPFGAAGGIPRAQALKRRLDICMGATTLDFCDDTDNSSTDFVLGSPAPTNNAGTSGTIPASTCGNSVLESLEACDDGNTANGDGCSSTCRLEAGGFTARQLAVDTSATASSNGNGIFEPAETAVLRPTWQNLAASARPVMGSASSFTGPAGSVLGIPDGNARYGTLASGALNDCQAATGDCYQLSADAATRPSLHWDTVFTEALSNGDLKAWTVHIGASFTDVSTASGFYRFIETVLHNGVTAGCGGTNYCPTSNVTRAQMAVFLLVSKDGASYVPPPCTVPIFNDVPCSNGFAKWVNELSNRGVTAGCGGGNYCPGNPVTREQMAVFLLRTREGMSYTPPLCTTPIFADVPCSSGFAPWINELFNRGVTGGCGGGNYCPTASNTRGQMAVFLTTTFGLTLYGP